MIDRSPFCSPIGGWNKYLILFQNTGNLPQSVPVQTKDKYPFDYFGSFGSNHSLLFDFRVFPASVRWGVAEMFPGFAFRLHHCANFLAGIFGVPRVEQRLFGKGKDKQAETQYSCGFAAGWLPKS